MWGGQQAGADNAISVRQPRGAVARDRTARENPLGGKLSHASVSHERSITRSTRERRSFPDLTISRSRRAATQTMIGGRHETDRGTSAVTALVPRGRLSPHDAKHWEKLHPAKSGNSHASRRLKTCHWRKSSIAAPGMPSLGSETHPQASSEPALQPKQDRVHRVTPGKASSCFPIPQARELVSNRPSADPCVGR